MADKYKVFVYGTLKRGFGNNRLLGGSKFLGKGVTEDKFALYESGIPFVIENESVSQISGEVYVVDRETLAHLDRLEGHPNWYCRKMVNILLGSSDDGNAATTIQGWIYFYSRRQGRLVKSGVFRITS